MGVVIPATDETWQRLQALSTLPRSASSAYWQDRRTEMAMQRTGDAITFDGLYSDVPEAPGWLSPGRLSWLRRLVGVGDARDWSEHPLTLAWRTRLHALPDPRLASVFSSYDLAKAEDTAADLPDGPILEIGGGACLVAAAMLRRDCQRYAVIDLPESMAAGFAVLRWLFPAINIALPGEPNTGARVTFHTPDSMPDETFAAAVNVTSFQELDPPIVAGYFVRLDDWLVPGGRFVCINRAVKTDPARNLHAVFEDYPWPEGWSVLRDDEPLISRWSGPMTTIRRRVIQKPTTACAAKS
ncbi:hypothetical protein [Thalassospira sp.]|uniref:hypothetical protein n=1 Tax=Thalassospira sp. TaxID=1912094 RepID=UPI001AFEA86F|nr:hypothetical protein [Thalassospira sp.]MBO6806753.1 hypothetical protein [Thalassospira sp.]MBO6840375.1 hypothetical protein [Thalassospira sp.]